MFQRLGLSIRRCLPISLILLLWLAVVTLVAPLRAQEFTPENSTTGTIQGTVVDEDGVPVNSARISYSSQAADTRGVTRAGNDGKYVTEALPPGLYVLHVDGRDLAPADTTVTVTAGSAFTANFKLDWINPGPERLESTYAGTSPDTLAINGRNFLTPSELFPGVQAVDGAIYEAGKSGLQSTSITSSRGRTTHFDADEIEIMDETKGAASVDFPAESVREVVLSRVTPEVFQSLNATGAVRVTTRSATANDWHGDLFGGFRDQFLGLAGFPSGPSDYSRQQYGFGAGGSVIKDKGFLFLSGERTKQDGRQSGNIGFPAPNLSYPVSAYFRENMLLARFDYNVSENTKVFGRLGYDNASQIGPPNSLSSFMNKTDVRSAAFGLDWNRGRFVRSVRFGYQKMVNAINPDLAASLVEPAAPFHIQFGSYGIGPSTAGPRQTIQRDLFGRYDSSTVVKVNHTLRFGGAVHYIVQGDYFAPGIYGPSVTSSNGLATISAINGNPLLTGGADNPLNYPVGTITIYNGLGNFSENSAFNRNTGGHSDTRLEGYIGDKINIIPNINFSIGVNYVLDLDRTDSDLSATPCSAINTSIVATPPCQGNSLLLDQFALQPQFVAGTALEVGPSIPRPYKNFSPQAGIAWDPGHNGRTVVRASGGMFFDNFLLQNTYQDRVNRLSNGQYNRSLTLCPTGSVLFPDSAALGHPDVVSSIDGLDIASQICGQPIGSVATAIQDLQNSFRANQASVAGGPNVYSLANSVANFGGLLSPTYRTPRIVHMSAGLERQMGERSMFSVDYIREIGTQFPLGIDTNHVGDSRFLTNAGNPDPALNTYAAELSAITATTTAVGCPAALFAGSSSQAAVNCYLSTVPGATIADFARHGLDSSNAFCGPFPCSVLGKQQAAFGGVNPAVGSNVMYFPAGRSQYQAFHVLYHTSSAPNPMRNVRQIDVSIAYTLSRYRTNIASSDGSGGDYSILPVAQDFNSPHHGHFGSSGLDRTHQIAFTPTVELPRGPRISMIALLASPLPLTAYLPQQNGGGVPGEIFRTDVTGDGTVGDMLPTTYIGSFGKYTATEMNKAIKYYNLNVAGRLTPAGQDLVGTGLMSGSQLIALGAYAPLISSCNPPSPSCGLPGRAAEETWLKTVDFRLTWPFSLGERLKIEPNFAIFNAFNFANFGGPGGQLSGILNGAPGSSLNNASSPGICGNTTSFCTSRLDRVQPGSGTFSTGAPRQMEFGVRFTF